MGPTAKALKIMRPVAAAAGAVNTLSMFIGAFTTDPRVFAVGLIGTGCSAYGWLFFVEEAELMEEHTTYIGYRRVAEELHRSIIEQGLQPGDRLASTLEIAARFQVGRRTVARALEVLVQQEVIEVIPGRGCYVAGGHPGDKRRDRVEAWLRMNARKGEYLPGTADLASECNVSPGTVRRVIADQIRRGLLERNNRRYRYRRTA